MKNIDKTNKNKKQITKNRIKQENKLSNNKRKILVHDKNLNAINNNINDLISCKNKSVSIDNENIV